MSTSARTWDAAGGSAAEGKRPTARWREVLFLPVLAPILRQPVATRLITAAAALQLSFWAFGETFWACPVRSVVGIPCPGCGLTRASTALLSGHPLEALVLNPAAPLLLLALLLISLAAVLPLAGREGLAGGIEACERRTGFTALGLFLLFGQWLVRLLVV